MDFISIKTINLLNESQQKDKELLEYFNNLSYSLNVVRTKQQDFREELINYFNVCPITKMISDECEAAHIIPVSENGSYTLSNGLLLGANIHKTFDKFLWSIDPETYLIKYKTNTNVGSIAKYPSDCLVDIIDLRWKKSLESHWNKFIKN